MTRRPLTDAERDLWRRAVRDVRPARSIPIDAAPVKSIDQPLSPRRTPRAGQSAKPHNQTLPPHFVFGGGDPAFDRAAATRRIAIDRVIDLHGLTQTEAHRLLLARIPEAVAKGERLVLVITGKGGAMRSGGQSRGVLRTRFFDWVEEHPLKALIARVAQAKPKDGGAGAFYVFLKRKGAGATRA